MTFQRPNHAPAVKESMQAPGRALRPKSGPGCTWIDIAEHPTIEHVFWCTVLRRRRRSMLQRMMIVVIAAVLATGPVTGQQGLQRPASALVGLPVFTSDGRLVGKISDLGRDAHGQGVLIAELERPLGLGPQTVAIPIDMFVQRPDRIELTIKADQVRDRLAGPDLDREQ